MNEHLDDPTLARLNDGELPADERAAAEAHLAACAACSQTLRSLRELVAALADDEVWKTTPAISLPERRTHASVEAQVSRRVAERAAAEAAAQRIDWSAVEPAALPAEQAFRSAEGIGLLCERARAELEKNPARSLLLARAALDAASPLGETPSSALLHARGMARKEEANALRFLGRHHEALASLDDAAETLQRAPAAHFELAIIDLARAAVLSQIDRYEETLALARRAGDVFTDYGDSRRALHARVTEAAVHYWTGAFAVARDLFLSLVREARESGDVDTHARVLHNLALCHIRLGELGPAATFLLQALAVYRELGRETELVRSGWALGRVLSQDGRHEEGLRRLEAAREGFESMSMTSDAALVTLDIIETLLSAGRPVDARQLCLGLVERFTEAGMTSNAITALAYLRETAAAGTPTPRVVQHVRSYLERLPSEPQLLFLPLPRD